MILMILILLPAAIATAFTYKAVCYSDRLGQHKQIDEMKERMRLIEQKITNLELHRKI